MNDRRDMTANPIASPVSIVIPAKNEAANLVPLIDEIASALSAQLAFEVVVVDDGSADDTAARMVGLMPARPWLRCVRHQMSAGKSAALRTGVMAARHPVIVTVDGDGQNDPSYIVPLVTALEAGGARVGLIAGQRARREDGAWKKLQSRVANAIRGKILKDNTRDSVCGLKAIHRSVFLLLPYFDTMHRFLPALVQREGYDVGHVDVVDRPRRHGSSHYGMWDRLLVGVPDLFGVWWLIRRRKRIPQYEEVTLAR
ncbi:MAG TPA: glycosyltransferase family 2 protein [Xanthobacteraceae bacterium]|nr:glycosyltransferase family 2 protein [Xanthobacteraceae bacterium]